jgi:hypothetical protein
LRILAGLCLLAAVVGLAATPRPNFSGRWRIDERQSSRGAPAELVQTVDHRDPVLRIDSDWNRNRPTSAAYIAMLAPAFQTMTDGSETTNEMPPGMSIATKSHWDGEKLVTEWRAIGLATEMRGEWTRRLNGTGNMLVDAVTETAGRRVSSHFVFVKT